MIRHYQYRPALYQRRRQQLIEQLPEKSLAVVVAHDRMPKSADQFFPYQPNPNLFYLTGIEHENVLLLLWKNDEQQEEMLFLPPYDQHKAVWEGDVLTEEEAVARAGNIQVLPLDHFHRYWYPRAAQAQATYLEYNQHPRYVPTISHAALRYAEKIRTDHPALPIRPLYPLLARMRMIKDEFEIQCIQKAIDIAHQALQYLVDELPHLKSEYEVEAFLHYNMIKAGADAIAFDTIVASGKNSTILHYTKNNAPLTQGELLLVDFGATVHGYCSDITRVISIGNNFSKRQEQVYKAVWAVQRQLIERMTPGTTFQELNRWAGQWITEQLLELGLLSDREVQSNPSAYQRYFMHGFGHHLGLDVHDAADNSLPLAPNMVITCEPGIYIPEENIGIRLENDILITEKGPYDLSIRIPYALNVF